MPTSVLADGSTLCVGAKGSSVATRLRPGYLLITVFGRDEGDLSDFDLEMIEKEIASAGFCVAFADAHRTSGASAVARERVSSWIRTHRSEMRGIHVLFGSKLVEMSVALINLVTGGVIRTYSDVGEFERAIASDVPGFRHLPSFESVPAVSSKR